MSCITTYFIISVNGAPVYGIPGVSSLKNLVRLTRLELAQP